MVPECSLLICLATFDISQSREFCFCGFHSSYSALWAIASAHCKLISVVCDGGGSGGGCGGGGDKRSKKKERKCKPIRRMILIRL